jgi:hypothetical protein
MRGTPPGCPSKEIRPPKTNRLKRIAGMCCARRVDRRINPRTQATRKSQPLLREAKPTIHLQIKRIKNLLENDQIIVEFGFPRGLGG